MKITPLDIRQKAFANAFKGFDRKEVEGFLELVAGEFEELVKENINLREELKRAQISLEKHLEREHTLQETMVTAQRISEEMKDTSRKEAEIIVSSAEVQAEKIAHDAHRKLVQIIGDVNEMKRQRAQFESEIRSVVEAHQRLLETFRTATATDKGNAERIEDNVSFFAPKKSKAD